MSSTVKFRIQIKGKRYTAYCIMWNSLIDPLNPVGLRIMVGGRNHTLFVIKRLSVAELRAIVHDDKYLSREWGD